jgi:hypothetical protein
VRDGGLPTRLARHGRGREPGESLCWVVEETKGLRISLLAPEVVNASRDDGPAAASLCNLVADPETATKLILTPFLGRLACLSNVVDIEEWSNKPPHPQVIARKLPDREAGS